MKRCRYRSCASVEPICSARIAASLVTVATALGLLAPAEAVFTSLGIPFAHTISIRVGSIAAVDTVDFGTMAGQTVGNNLTVTAPGAVDVVVNALTLTAGSRTVSVNADSSAGISCQIASSCRGTTIPFSTVGWTVGNSVARSESSSLVDIQAGSFNGSASQTIASFPSGQRLSNTLSFKYANATVYPAGSYRGRITFTASTP